ncbi:hypothetical protein F5X71_34435 [Nocardia brasiliensis]|uniref:Uncharacterized protein n=1 Tax=Nocardia brasiliensis TaxID=37326 RepID=A0A6G9Y0S9_NOCBR|nr:hypothetical protein [Nocardia brasiliensis]QIS06726.1 hypothetical protein F5X71_34435 [Nocardia brasiliensis]
MMHEHAKTGSGDIQDRITACEQAFAAAVREVTALEADVHDDALPTDQQRWAQTQAYGARCEVARRAHQLELDLADGLEGDDLGADIVGGYRARLHQISQFARDYS